MITNLILRCFGFVECLLFIGNKRDKYWLVARVILFNGGLNHNLLLVASIRFGRKLAKWFLIRLASPSKTGKVAEALS